MTENDLFFDTNIIGYFASINTEKARTSARLLKRGGRLALAAWGLMLAAAASALWALRAGETVQYAILFVWSAAYALLVLAVGWLTRRKA